MLIGVSATGTELGKTFVSRVLLHQARAKGINLRAIKPVASGVAPGAEGESDPGLLAAAMGHTVKHESLVAISPWMFEAPVSPDRAAARVGRRITLTEMVVFCRRSAEREAGSLLIEGAGGIMSPLCADALNVDLFAALECPVVLVAGSYLGTISHTLTALAALAARGIPAAGVVVSQSVSEPMPFAETIETLAPHCAPTPVFALPRINEIGRAPDLTALLDEPMLSE
ncbi:MAG: dethiobiotin synthase [Alphaproteobacteria bacterium]|nr:dethiobiotin synthase [Alphaproteobacteria bacterium]